MPWKNSQIPSWVNIMQVILILIMVVQVFENLLNHDALISAGLSVEGDPQLNLIYEMGTRLLVMVIISVMVVITQNPMQYVVVLVMNVAREGMEMIVDPLWPVADAPAGPLADFLIHVVIVAIEIAALVAVLKVIKRNQATATAAS